MYHHYGYGMGSGGFGLLGALWDVLSFVILIVIIVWVVKLVFGRGHHRGHLADVWNAHSALSILNERYAKGEIEKEEYEERRRTLSS